MSLRNRITLLYSLVFAAMIAAFGTIIYIQTSQRLYASVDDTLNLRAERIIAERGEPGVASAPTDQTVLDEIASPGVYVELLDPDGNVTSRSSNLAQPLPLPKATERDQTFNTHETSNNERVRVLYRNLQNSGEVLLVARSLHPTDAALDRIRAVLIGGGIAFLFVSTGLVYLVAAFALRPIQRAAETASAITATGDFSRRLESHEPGEVGMLVRTLNELIAGVERTLGAHRDFLADSSHELRRPLAVLRGDLEVLQSAQLSESEQQALIAEADAEAHRMSRILADLLLLSHVDAKMILQREPIDLTELARAIVERERQRFPARDITFQPAERPLIVNADTQRVSQLLENLVENAALYSSPEGRIELSLRRDGAAVAEIRDGGPGMGEDEAQHAFERFFRGRRGRQQHADGTGLGLAIARHIARAHGGDVTLQSSRSGTRVTVRLPLAQIH